MRAAKKVKKIGLLGGTFNPVHLGHLILAGDAMEAFSLDAVWFIPCAHPAHKPLEGLAGAEDRCALLERAVADNPRFRVSRVELDRPGISYTVDTLHALGAANPDVEWFFIIGADTLTELHSWRDVEEVLRCCRMIHMRRPGIPPGDELTRRIRLPAPWAERLLEGAFSGHLIEISSSEIRKRVAESRSIRYLVPPSVEAYIHEHHLYR